MKNSEPAFPLPAQIVRGLDDPSGEFPPGSGSANLLRQPGMSLRDYFAAAALQGYCACPEGAICREDGTYYSHPITSAILAELSYQAADAMLAEREKP